MEINKITPQIAGMLIGQTADLLWDGEFDRTGKLVEIQPETPQSNGLGFDCDKMGLLFYPYSDVIFHLRKLDSIAEDEARELYEAGNGEAWDGDYECTRWLEFDDDFGYANKLGWFIGNPPAWLYLISKGFDVLGLIDKGLAKEIKS